MRIGQLARRLELSPSVLLEFLSSQGIETEGSPNSRLSDEDTRKIVSHFAPEQLLEPASEPVAEVVEEVVEVVPEHSVVVEETKTEPESEEAPPEVIRVSKVELQGLKVLGKIDLPEPKKKPEPEQLPEQPRREFQKHSERSREWRNPIEAKRQQEQREAERKKNEQAERLKEKRTNHYYNKVKSVPTKAVRRIEEQTVVEDIEMKEPPKGLFGRFFKWLRT